MSRINTNVSSQIAQRILGQNNKTLNTTLERLSTGLRVNRGKDDPAGLIASENLRGEKTALSAAISNAERTDQLANIAEGGLQEVSNLLTDLQGLITSTANNAGLSAEEKQANQLQIDSILQTIDRVADATNFQGVKLLNGNFDFRTSAVAGGVSAFRVNGAKIATNSYTDVQALITGSAQKGTLFLSTGASLNLGGNTGQFTIEIAGAGGSRQLSFASGTARQSIIDAVNSFKDITGVTASTTTADNGGIVLRSTEYGSDNFVSVKVINAAGISGTGVGVFTANATDAETAVSSNTISFTSTTANNGVRDAGKDVLATINGVAATTRGRTARINTDFLDVELTFNASTATRASTLGNNRAFYITGGGAEFQLAGRVNIAGKVALGIQDISARKLGGQELDPKNTGSTAFYYLNDLASGKNLNVVDGNLSDAQKVVSESIRQISSLRGRLGAFQKNTVGATIRSLNVSLENSAAAESVIRDADFATETAQLTRGQILASASTNVLGIANQAPQSALQLLR
jgi:flagellin